MIAPFFFTVYLLSWWIVCTVLVQVSGRPNPFLWWTHWRGAFASLKVVNSGLSGLAAGSFVCPIKLIYSAPLQLSLLEMMLELILLLLPLARPLMQEIIVLPSCNDFPLLSWWLMALGLPKLWSEAAYWSDGDPCLSRDPPVFPWQERMYSFDYQGWSDEWPCSDAGENHRGVVGLGNRRAWSVLDAFLCAQCLHVVSEQRLVLPCLCADPQGKSIPSPTPPWCFWSGMGTPTVGNCTITTVLAFLPRCAGLCLHRLVLCGVMILASAKSSSSVTLGPLSKYTLSLPSVTWWGLTFKQLCSGPFIPCTCQGGRYRTTWSRWRSLSRKESHASLAQPSNAPLPLRIGKLCWWRKAAVSFLAEIQTQWSSIECTRPSKR